ncbi:MAG: DoxX family protein [Verrucomicrobia bacterium]|nr:DoxX family protein [Verrucomicrobiota bacterium]
MLTKTGNFFGHLLLLVIRIYWGYLLVVAGLGKLTNLSESAQFFASIYFPAPLFSAALAGVIETVAGIFLILGLFSRFVALFMVIYFLIAYATAHHQAFISFFSQPSLFFSQKPFLYLYTNLLVFCFGPGKVALDTWFGKKNR